jgi:hypothetical protein
MIRLVPYITESILAYHIVYLGGLGCDLLQVVWQLRWHD